jgi:hypothetical protein
VGGVGGEGRWVWDVAVDCEVVGEQFLLEPLGGFLVALEDAVAL